MHVDTMSHKCAHAKIAGNKWWSMFTFKTLSNYSFILADKCSVITAFVDMIQGLINRVTMVGAIYRKKFNSYFQAKMKIHFIGIDAFFL